ncbi:hypothetical protein I553_3251 [Mycobacterium xenopi 4042]|uniref:Uncharacterized protein n=1 Tax=Mycobacterium xenopi 4042 TaxID=1299334 RepID=X8E5Z5_MYCXE|nr:hypothetical protein I553_3251 [Mycobacterium xenopi 4042]
MPWWPGDRRRSGGRNTHLPRHVARSVRPAASRRCLSDEEERVTCW